MHSAHSRLYVVMGVAGSGKSLIGEALARALAIEFVEGDNYHSAENVRKMASGIPLTDEDRAGWLRSLAVRIREAKDAGTGLVLACSALKRSYRDVLRAGASPKPLQFIFLRGQQSLIADRIAGRRGHYMAPALLSSQFDALQKPAPDENAWICEITGTPQEIVDALVARTRE